MAPTNQKRIIRDEFEFNGAVLPGRWATTLVGSATAALNAGQVDLSLIATNEVESARMSFGDQLSYPIDQIVEMRIWAKITASLNAAITACFGLASAGNAAQTSIAQRALFRLVGNNSVVINTSDGTLTNTDIAANDTLVNAWKLFTINFKEGKATAGPPISQVGGQGGKSDILFAMDNTAAPSSAGLRRVAQRTLFSMANYGGGLQPYFQIQKTIGTSTGTLSVRRVEVEYRL